MKILDVSLMSYLQQINHYNEIREGDDMNIEIEFNNVPGKRVSNLPDEAYLGSE